MALRSEVQARDPREATPPATGLPGQRELDLRHVFHPYTNITRFEQGPYTSFVRGSGVYLYTADEKPVLDGIASWWCTALGHGHPRIVEAIREQTGVLQQSMLGNVSHPKAVELAVKLAQIAPGDLSHTYFASDGASATEAALKMAIQYWWNIGRPEKHGFISLEDGYHGDTLGVMGVGFVSSFHGPFGKAIHRALVAPTPWAPCNSGDEAEERQSALAVAALRGLFERHHHELAGFILEPLIQGAAGIRVYPESYLRAARELCDEYEILLIADEIAVGFGRTGARFACDRAGIVPDILCLGKALSGGYLPASAAIVPDRIYETFRSTPEQDRTFYDGHTFCGNPITSAACVAAIDVYESEAVFARAQALTPRLRAGIQAIARNPNVEHWKALGMVGMLRFKPTGGVLTRAIAQRAMDLGLLIRPLGDVLYLWPPLVATDAELDAMLARLEDAVNSAA